MLPCAHHPGTPHPAASHRYSRRADRNRIKLRRRPRRTRARLRPRHQLLLLGQRAPPGLWTQHPRARAPRPREDRRRAPELHAVASRVAAAHGRVMMSGRQRRYFSEIAREGIFDLFMVRYNAAHRGAEREAFPALPAPPERPGICAYTSTRWGTLLDPKNTPPGERSSSTQREARVTASASPRSPRRARGAAARRGGRGERPCARGCAPRARPRARRPRLARSRG